ncbi:MAG: hypothetical protein ACPGU5_06765 [Lishizhenia sp.]
MNTNLHVVLALFLCLKFTAFGIAPPDSTSTLLNRTASFLTVEEGKKAFFQGQTKLALIKFRQAYAKDENNAKAIFWIAKSHYKLNNYGYALEYAKKAEISDPEVDADVYYIIASSFHRKAVLDSALIFYKIAEDKMRNSRFKELGLTTKMKECQTADSLMKIPRKFERKLLEGEVNSGYDDYGPILTADGNTLYFVSRRNDTQGGGINPDDQTFFEDTYKAVWNKSENKWDSITNDLGKLNSAGFDALNTISEDELTGYLTLNTTALAIKKQTKSSDICSIEMSANAKWGTPKPIKNKSINSSFFDGAATLTADGNTLYFVSDRKGEKYKTDIYVAHKNGRKWGDAVRLPANINTPGFETTPYISEDGLYLFFSSDGLNGMGGYDIYVSEKKANNEWTDPVNLGASFNTVNDDTHFRYYPKLAKAYLSSFRLQDRKSSRDIYEIDMQTFEIPK